MQPFYLCFVFVGIKYYLVSLMTQNQPMNKTIQGLLLIGFIILSGFVTEPSNIEQKAFDFFMSDIFVSDFKDVAAIEFKGKTEEKSFKFGSQKFCLKPVEKLQAIMKDKGDVKATPKDIRFDQFKNVSLTGLSGKAEAKLYLYHSMNVANMHYVFVSLERPGKPVVSYVIELTWEGEIQRSCALE
jgi:hypothetical protein